MKNHSLKKKIAALSLMLLLLVCSGWMFDTAIRAGNGTFSGNVTAASVSATSNVPFSALSGSSNNMQINIGRASTEANIAIPQGNGFYFTNSDLAAGDMALRLVSSTNRIYLGSGASGAPVSISNVGANFYTATGTLPGAIKNDTAGGLLFVNNAGGSMQLGNGGTLFLNNPQGVRFTGATSGTTVLQAAGIAGSGVLTLPASVTDTLVAKTTTDTLTNKTLTAPVIGTTVMSEAPRMTFSAHVTGGANQETVTVLWGRFIPDKPITVTRVTVVSYVSQLGATTAPQFQVTDGTTVAATITIANSSIAIDSGALSANYAAGANVDIKCSTSQAGTTTFPVFNIIVEYKMQ